MSGWLWAQSTIALAGTDSLPAISSFSWFFWRTLVVLGGLLLVSVVLLKVVLPLWVRRCGRNGPGLIEIVEAHRLDSRKLVYLMRVGNQFYLVGSCDGQLTTLAGQPLDNQAIADALNSIRQSPSARPSEEQRGERVTASHARTRPSWPER